MARITQRAVVPLGVHLEARAVVAEPEQPLTPVTRYALVWSSMIGAAVAYRHGSHVAVTDLVKRLPSALGRQTVRGVHMLVFAFGAFLLWQGWALTMRNFARHQLSTSLEIEIAWIYLSIPLGGALLMLAALEAFIRGARITSGATSA